MRFILHMLDQSISLSLYTAQHKGEEMMKTMITAHSGADNTKDNSMQFINYAITTKADALEMDIRRMNDTLVISHDEPNPNNPSTYTDLSVVFLAIRRNPSIRINCDLKQPGLEAPVLEAAEKLGLEKRLIYSGTVSIDRMKSLPENSITVFLNIEEYVPDVFNRCAQDPSFIPEAAERICSICRDGNIPVVNTNYLIATEQFLTICRKNDIGVSVWTVKEEEEMKRFLRDGVTNITTRNLSLALKTAGR